MGKRAENEIRYERDMYAPVKAWLQAEGWEVKAEVAGCDAVALRDGRMLALEMKLTLNLDVVLQALARQRVADAAVIAIPRKPKAMANRRWREAISLLQRLNLGLVVVTVRGGQAEVEEVLTPGEEGAAKRGYAARRRVIVQREFDGRTGDRNTGGVHRQKLMTAYREAALALAAQLDANGAMNAPALKPTGGETKRTYHMLRNNPYGWFRAVGGGKFELTELGRKELKLYGVQPDVQEEEDVFGGTVAD